MAAPPAARRTATAPSPRTPADVETALWRALAVFRVVVLGFAVAVAFASWDELRRPAVAAAVLALMTVWTVVQPLLVARAIENQAYVVGVNRVGTAGDGTEHVGGTCVIDPWGDVVAEAGERIM